jgi:hypothetical protein
LGISRPTLYDLLREHRLSPISDRYPGTEGGGNAP